VEPGDPRLLLFCTPKGRALRVSQVNLHQIAGFDYQVSDTGLVYSLSRTVVRSNGRPYTVPAKLLKPRWNSTHWQVILYCNGERHHRFVHRLVLESFVGPPPDGMVGLHRDDNPHNNHVSNLYWGTMRENALDRVRNGNDVNARKTNCVRGHLLEPPNLAPWSAYRVCLACNRANTLANYRGVSRGNEAYRQSLSDEKYALITSPGKEVCP